MSKLINLFIRIVRILYISETILTLNWHPTVGDCLPDLAAFDLAALSSLSLLIKYYKGMMKNILTFFMFNTHVICFDMYV